MTRGVSAGTRPAAVLFDLDGTLVDTAPDMVSALNALLLERDLPPQPFGKARAFVSNGAAGLLRLSYPEFETTRDRELHQRFLALYAERICLESCLFPGMEELLARLEGAGVPWGVVTNKPGALTEALLKALDLRRRAACIVSGDTLPERKPHPRPVLHALETLGAPAAESWYAGDAHRDIQSGRAAGTRTVAVRYGYVEPGQDPHAWGADAVVDTIPELDQLFSPIDNTRPLA